MSLISGRIRIIAQLRSICFKLHPAQGSLVMAPILRAPLNSLWGLILEISLNLKRILFCPGEGILVK